MTITHLPLIGLSPYVQQCICVCVCVCVRVCTRMEGGMSVCACGGGMSVCACGGGMSVCACGGGCVCVCNLEMSHQIT